jgi:hypothetical protein
MMAEQRNHRDDRNYFCLLLSLVGVLILYPYLPGFFLGRFLLLFLAVVAIAAAVIALSADRWKCIAGVVLAIPVVVIAVWFAIEDSRGLPAEGLRTTILVLSAAFLAYSTLVILGFVLSAGPVSRGKLFGAVAVYLLMGITWATLYVFLEHVSPGSFSLGIDSQAVMGPFIYYSFVTLTTLGYGEITPVTDAARSLALLEAVAGVLYIAILVARLVGLYHREEADQA